MGWISVEERLPAFQEETSILCLLKEQKGFWYPRPYALLIEVGWWIPQKKYLFAMALKMRNTSFLTGCHYQNHQRIRRRL